VPLATVIAGRIRNQAALLDESQCSRRGRLVDADRIGKLRRGEIRSSIQHLQHSVLSRVQAAVSEDRLIECGHGPRGLPERRAITGKR